MKNKNYIYITTFFIYLVAFWKITTLSLTRWEDCQETGTKLYAHKIIIIMQKRLFLCISLSSFSHRSYSKLRPTTFTALTLAYLLRLMQSVQWIVEKEFCKQATMYWGFLLDILAFFKCVLGTF